MKTNTPSLKTSQATHLWHRQLICQLLGRDKTLLVILFMAVVVGMLVGLTAVAFDKGVAWLQNQRMGALIHTTDDYPSLLTVAFLCSTVLTTSGYLLVCKYTSKASGSGIPEIEGALGDQRPARRWHMLPVKFFGGSGTLGGGVALGHEGPTMQMGGNIGQMVPDVFRLKGDEARHALLAISTAAGLTAVFNASLAGILFIIEGTHPQFCYVLISVEVVFIGVIMLTIMYRAFNHEVALTDVGKLSDASLSTPWLCLILGIIFGIFGSIFDKQILGTQGLLHRVHGDNITEWASVGGAISGPCGLLGFVAPATPGGGFSPIPIATAGNFSMGMLVFIFVAQVITTLLCLLSDAPGGISAPMLALGTVSGIVFGIVAAELSPQHYLEAGASAIAGVGALLMASIRVPSTGVTLVLEVTDNYQLILPMTITGFGATLSVRFTGRKPLYSAIPARTLTKQEAEQLARSKAASAHENT